MPSPISHPVVGQVAQGHGQAEHRERDELGEAGQRGVEPFDLGLVRCPQVPDQDPGREHRQEPGQLKHRLRPMRGLCTDRTAQVVIAGHAFMQNLRRGHYELGLDVPPALRVAAAFTELASAI
jgi:hypothetical protein